MDAIRPVSDLRNRFAEISRQVHESDEAVILTRNGHADMVVMSYEKYQAMLDDVFSIRRQQAEKARETSLEARLKRLEELLAAQKENSGGGA